ncbi:hypothetical protein WOB59_11230 [Methylocystis sp. IM4]|jgi:hypothetical protein|uniref:hypothetical protein n=2 Tax=Methylocystis TaxID=133 RepID=UPI00269535BA
MRLIEKGNAMANHESNLPKDKYTGMRSFDFAITPNVLICAAAGAVLGLVLALWGTSDLGIVTATVIVFSILSGIFGMFV